MHSKFILAKTTYRKQFHCSIYVYVFMLLQLCDSIDTKEHRAKKFFVESAKCKMAYVETFPPDVKSIWDPPEFESCTDNDDFDLVTSNFDFQKRHYILKINRTLIRKNKRKYNLGKVMCAYQEIKRARSGRLADKTTHLLPKVWFTENYVVPKQVHSVIVECYHNTYATVPMYKVGFAFIQDRDILYKERPNYQPNVIMIGVDSMSRMNFLRNMPLTSQFMSNRSWFELQGYSKVDDNTLPNLLAVLTGYTTEQADSTICNTDNIGCFDKLPFVWKDFQKAGYFTAYAEDLASINTFSYFKPGFIQEPVDYYLRPFMFTAEKLLKVKKVYNYDYCLDRRLSANYIWDYCQQFVDRFLDRNPIFGLFWTNSFTHDYFDTASTMDTRMLEFFKNLEDIGLFKDSIVIFFSDHGMRWGQLRSSKDGFLEERLPLLHISLPTWFIERYPAYATALNINRNRLSSNYDLHMTLQHILNLDKSAKDIKPSKYCPDCQSLFFALPVNRSCSDAGIAEHWCTCDPYETISDNLTYTLELPNAIINHMNEYLHLRGVSDKCRNLTLHRAKTVERKIDLNNEGRETLANNSNAWQVYRVHFIADPNEAVFEATVRYNEHTRQLDLQVETISRLSSYKFDAKCLQHKILKKYCICKDYVSNMKE